MESAAELLPGKEGGLDADLVLDVRRLVALGRQQAWAGLLEHDPMTIGWPTKPAPTPTVA